MDAVQRLRAKAQANNKLTSTREQKVTTTTQQGRLFQTHNEIAFRSYQKYGTEVKIVEDDDFPTEPPPKKP